MHKDFHGVFPYLVSPIDAEGRVMDGVLARLCDDLIAKGVHGLTPLGSTGEFAYLTHAQKRRVVEVVVEAAAGRVPVIAGAGSNSTAEAIDLTKAAKAAGADAALVVTPYYNRPTQEGLYQHFKAIAEQGGLPVIIYNIPGRSAVDMSVETMARLAKLPNIVGVKDATANLARPLHQKRDCGEDFCQLSGEDHTAVAFLASGGDANRQSVSVKTQSAEATRESKEASTASSGSTEDRCEKRRRTYRPDRT